MLNDITIENSREQYEHARHDGYTGTLPEFVADVRRFAVVARDAVLAILDDGESSDEMRMIADEATESATVSAGIELLETWLMQREARRLKEPNEPDCDCAGCLLTARFAEEARAVMPALIAAVERRAKKLAAKVVAMSEAAPEDLGDRLVAAKTAVAAIRQRPDIEPHALASAVAAALPPGATFTAVRLSPDGVEIATERTGPPKTGPERSMN